MTHTARRTLLKLAGGIAALGSTGLASTDQATQELAINAPSDQQYQYQFAVTGQLEQTDHATQAPINNAHVTADAEDDIDQCRVHGVTRGGYDCYQYTGDLVAFVVPERHISKYTIYHNGAETHARDLLTERHPSDVACGPTDMNTTTGGDQDGGESRNEDFCPLDNRVAIIRNGPQSVGPVQYTIGVSGELELPSGRRVRQTEGTIRFSGGTEKREFVYSGELVQLSVSNHASVRVTQESSCE